MDESQTSNFDIRGSQHTELTIELAWNIGKALADSLSTIGNIAVAGVSSQQAMTNALIEGARLQGRAVVDAGHADRQALIDQIKTNGLSGGAVVGYDSVERVATIELYKEGGVQLSAETGLPELYQQALAGNFVPAAIKGELTVIA